MDAVFTHNAEKNVLVLIGSDYVLPLTPYQSSRITHAGYDAEAMVLYVAYPSTKNKPNGSVYAYKDVEPDTWEGFEVADSKGSFLIAHVIGKRGTPPPYQYREIFEQGSVDQREAQILNPTDADAEGGTSQTPTNVLTASATNGERSADDTIPELPAKDEQLVDRAIAVKTAAAALTKLDGRVIVIASPENYALAGNRVVAIKAERKLVEERLNRVYDPAYKAYKEALKLKQDALAPYDDAEKMLKGGMVEYNRREQAERARAERQAREAAEAENRRIAEQQSRQDAEHAALHFEAQGEPELAQSARANPLPVAPAPVAPIVMPTAVPEVKGVSKVKEKWEYRIVDETKIPLTHEFYTLDPKKLQNRANTLKAHGTVPGAVECFDAGSISVRSK